MSFLPLIQSNSLAKESTKPSVGAIFCVEQQDRFLFSWVCCTWLCRRAQRVVGLANAFHCVPLRSSAADATVAESE